MTILITTNRLTFLLFVAVSAEEENEAELSESEQFEKASTVEGKLRCAITE